MDRGNTILLLAVAFLVIACIAAGCQTSRQSTPAIATEELVDGVYEGSYAQLPNIATVRVTLKDHRIAEIQIVSHVAWKGKKAEGPILERIIEKQSPQVDAVTGATNSSQTLMKAVQAALEKAHPKQG